MLLGAVALRTNFSLDQLFTSPEWLCPFLRVVSHQLNGTKQMVIQMAQLSLIHFDAFGGEK